MVNCKDIYHLIEYVLDELQRTAQTPGWNSREAKMLVLRTGLAESNYVFLRQRSSRKRIGRARGFWQFEPWVAQSIINDYLEYRESIYQDIERICMCDLSKLDDPDELEIMRFQLQGNLLLEIGLCRLKYRPVPARIPRTVKGQSLYWKDHYNIKGKADPVKFVRISNIYLKGI